MLEFFKLFGQGILYTILSPFLLAYYALFLVYTMINYIVCEVYSLVFFFFGGGCSSKTKLEKELERREMSAIIAKEENLKELTAEESMAKSPDVDYSNPYDNGGNL